MLQCVEPFRRGSRVWRTDRRKDGPMLSPEQLGRRWATSSCSTSQWLSFLVSYQQIFLESLMAV